MTVAVVIVALLATAIMFYLYRGARADLEAEKRLRYFDALEYERVIVTFKGILERKLTDAR